MENNLLELLFGLRASSRHSNVSEGGSDHIQEKLYIETELDTYLETALRKEGEEKWDLIVLGGNAGDGKSALIQKTYSHLPQQIADNIIVNWDATHSDDPNESQLDILGSFFSPFQNEKKVVRPEKTHLIAMNTGMIVSFFEKAKELDSSLSILQSHLYYYLDLINEKAEEACWRILLINLDQRNLLTYGQEDQPSIFKRMMDKININNENSFLYEAFQQYNNTPEIEKDPVYLNLMALSNPKVQSQIEKAVFKTIIKHDLHFTPRSAWDLLYHLITADNISGQEKKETKELGESLFFQHMFQYKGDNEILNQMQSSDPCLLSTQVIDSYVIQISLQPQIDNLNDVPFGKKLLEQIKNDVDNKNGYSATEYALFCKRRSYFFPETHEIAKTYNEKEQLIENYERLIKEYVAYGMFTRFEIDPDIELEQLQILIDSLRTAIVTTFGELDKKDLFQLQELKNSGRFRVLTKLELPDESLMEPSVKLKNNDPDYYKVIQFAPREVLIGFKNKNGMSLGELTVDFGLFELLDRIRKGYNPSSVDMYRYHHFKFFCTQLFTKLAETSTMNAVTIHDRIQDVYINIKPPQGLLKKKFEVEKV